MNSRLRTLRLARGYTLSQLAHEMGNVVTIMALSKYERGLLSPSPRVHSRLALALRVPPWELFESSCVSVRFLWFRRRFDLRKRNEVYLRNLVQVELEHRVLVQELVAPGERPYLPRPIRVRSLEDAENAAIELRRFWNLGSAPIRNLTSTLESHHIHVIGVDGPAQFDGICALAYQDDSLDPVACAVVSRRMVSGERWRMNLAHELGHIVMETAGDGVDAEKAAFRFASALLAPAPTLLHDVGTRRRRITMEELSDLRDRYGLSMQALLYRMQVLGILSATCTTRWWKYFNANGLRKKEPGESAPEQPEWMRRNVRKACCEGLLCPEEAVSLLPDGEPLGLTGPELKPPEADEEVTIQEKEDRIQCYGGVLEHSAHRPPPEPEHQGGVSADRERRPGRGEVLTTVYPDLRRQRGGTDPQTPERKPMRARRRQAGDIRR